VNLEMAILETLAASPRAIPATVITGFVSGYTGQDHTQTDVELKLKSLERKGHVKGTANEDRGTLWKETDDGRLRIA
jgi:hypothetical protein